MSWYLIQTKPRAENVALENLSNQGYECYLPMLKVQRRVGNLVDVEKVPLFPRYLFIKLELDFFSKGSSSVRSTRGVTQLVRFGLTPARVDDELIELIRAREFECKSSVEPLYKTGQTIKILTGVFAGFESLYQGMDPQMRVVVLLEFMNKSLEVKLKLDQIKGIK
jgi:transcriptional antiterminator RfaH